MNVDELVSAQAKGYSLQQAFYRDPEIFERDIERIHLRHWLAVGHESLIPDTGNFFVFDIVNESLVIVRGDDGCGTSPTWPTNASCVITREG